MVNWCYLKISPGQQIPQHCIKGISGRSPQHSSAVRLELIKHLQFTAVKMFKCLKGEESVRCLWVLRAARKDDVSEEMHDYLIAQCSNVSLNIRHMDA